MKGPPTFNRQRRADLPPLSGPEAIRKLKLDQITVIDVRDAAELAVSGTAKGGLHIPLALIPVKANAKGPGFDTRLDASKPVGVFCAVGGRAGMAVQVLQALGFQAHNLGGFSDWAAGGPIQR